MTATRSLVLRLVAAGGVAVVAIAVLAVTVERRDAAAARRADTRRRVAAVDAAPPRPGFVLPAIRGRVLLAVRSDSIAPGVAPVVQILADGSAAVRRPAPLPIGPLPGGNGSGEVAILLPAGTLGHLGPAARGTLVELIGQLLPVRPVPSDRVQAVDFAVAAGELSALLAWAP